MTRALGLGVLFHISHRIFRKNSNLTQAVGVGLYLVSTLFLFVIPIGVVLEKFGSETTWANAIIFFVTISLIFVFPWQMYSFSRHGFGNSKGVAAAVAFFNTVLVLAGIAGFGILMSFLK